MQFRDLCSITDQSNSYSVEFDLSNVSFWSIRAINKVVRSEDSQRYGLEEKKRETVTVSRRYCVGEMKH